MPQFRIGFTLSTRLLSPLSLSPGTPGTHTTRRQNLSPAATYQTCICSEEKQRNIIYRGPCCFLKHFIKKKIFFCFIRVFLCANYRAGTCRATAKRTSSFPSRNSLSSWKKKHRNNDLESLDVSEVRLELDLPSPHRWKGLLAGERY